MSVSTAADCSLVQRGSVPPLEVITVFFWNTLDLGQLNLSWLFCLFFFSLFPSREKMITRTFRYTRNKSSSWRKPSAREGWTCFHFCRASASTDPRKKKSCAMWMHYYYSGDQPLSFLRSRASLWLGPGLSSGHLDEWSRSGRGWGEREEPAVIWMEIEMPHLVGQLMVSAELPLLYRTN